MQGMNSRQHILSARIMWAQHTKLSDQNRHFCTDRLSELGLYRSQYEDLNHWNYDNDGILSLAGEIFKDLGNKDIPSALSNHLFHTVVRMKHNLDETDNKMARDLNVLLAICRSSHWFTEKQKLHFFFVDDGFEKSNKLQMQQLDIVNRELARSQEELKSARRELAEAKDALTKAKKRNSVAEVRAQQVPNRPPAKKQAEATPPRVAKPPRQARKQANNQPTKQERNWRQIERDIGQPDYSFARNVDDY